MHVRDVMIPLVESVRPDDILRDAAEKMKALDLDPLPVTEDGRLIGLLDHGAVEARAARDGLAAGTTRVREVMSPDTPCIGEDMDLATALQELGNSPEARQFARIPVVDASGALVGSITVEALRKRHQAEEAPDAGEAAVFGVESISSMREFDDDRVDYMSDESFPASDPIPPPSTLGPEWEDDRD